VEVYVAGVGMTRFEKPGRRDWDYPDMAGEAVTAALTDAGLTYDDVQQAVVGYVYGDSTAGQRALYPIGMTGIPVYNVNNNCSTGSTALLLAAQLVRGGLADVVLAAGFEKMQRGSLTLQWADRTSPLDHHLAAVAKLSGWTEGVPLAPQVFAAAGREHAERYGTTDEQFALVGVKNHRHSEHNPYAQFRDVYTLEEVLASPLVQRPLTRLQCSPTSEGAAAAVVVSGRVVAERGLGRRAVQVAAQAMTTDRPDTFDSAVQLVGSGLTREAAEQVYEEAGLGPDDVDVIELHDCFSTNELITYEALGLCEPGASGPLVADGATTYGGRWVVNPSGGLISKGHPLGATGLAQCAELTWQLRGEADGRQVAGARTALQHNIGLGGAAVVTLYRGPATS
jgi:acetyl-CoA acyltransferase